MEDKIKPQYYMIDILKYIFCIGIVALHTELLKCFGQYEYWIEKGFVRLGVPFFFMVSGFMLERKISGTSDKSVFISWSKRLLKPLIVFEIINTVLFSIYYALIGQDIIHIFLLNVRSIIFYPKGALWYLQACLIGVWIIYFFSKRKKNWIIPTGLIFYGFALLCNNYYFLVSHSVIGKIINIVLKIISSARNGIFYGFLFIALGMLAFKIRKWLDNKKYGNYIIFILLVLAYTIFLIEIYYLRNKEVKDDGSLYIMLPLLIILLVIFSASFVNMSKITIPLRNLSTGIYLIHYPILMLYRIIIMICDINIGNEWVFIAVIVLAHIICLSAYAKNKRLSSLLK